MGVSKNNGTPKSSILVGFSIIFTIHFGIPCFWKRPYDKLNKIVFLAKDFMVWGAKILQLDLQLPAASSSERSLLCP